MILLQNVSKYYYTDTSVTQALHRINLEFQMGEFVAITGESGSGKSTLLNIISGMDTFDEGEMYFNGEPTFPYDASDWEEFRRNQIGFVFQNYNLIGHYSVLENIISALLIMEMEEGAAKEQALYYLERVGLKGLENQKASELSSGQKQRLSIARALAKNTGVIIADEPTGNLDSETGKQIICLLKELSRDRLVLMVTHNYEQAEPFVTRKVRLHDGEVVEDIRLHEEQIMKEEPLKEKGIRKGESNLARTFARMNTRTQRGKAFLFRTFFFIIAAVSFVFIGQIYKNIDDTGTKEYDYSIYYQKNDSRLSVSRKDGEAITTKDLEKMKSIRNVTMVDLYDYVNDINYYVQEGKDYHFKYELNSFSPDNGLVSGTKDELHSGGTPVFDKKNKFMKSISCIEKGDLAAGRMPEKRNEIVMYTSDQEKLNKEMEIYFTAENITGDNYYHSKFKVVGILKEKTSQIYFHGDLCHMLSAPADGDQISMEYLFDDKAQKYKGVDYFYMVINDEIAEEEEEGSLRKGRVSSNYIVPAMGEEFYSVPVEEAVPGTNPIYIALNMDRKGIPEELEELGKIKRNTTGVPKTLLRDKGEDAEQLEISGNVFHNQSGQYMEVSQATFDKYFPRKSTQASVYIKNYTKTNQVIRKLEKLGYIAISTYRVSSVGYNQEKVMNRLVYLSISLGILLVLLLVEVLILRSMMKIKIGDFIILKSLGMKLGDMNKISLYEMTRYCIESMVAAVVIMFVLHFAGIKFINSMIIYYGVLATTTFILYNLFLEYITVRMFNRLLKGKMAR